jgi:hypothetical protein
MGQRWQKPAFIHTLVYGKAKKYNEFGTGFFVHKRIISAIT